MSIAVVLGTSNPNGNTKKLVAKFAHETKAMVFNLTDFKISFYDYAHENKDDDFSLLIKRLVKFDHIVFATPVYWYSMSAQMKVFFDRLSDLLTIKKDLGRLLKGKSLSVLSTGYDKAYPKCFLEPFKLTANYLQVNYLGIIYVSIRDDNIDLIDNINIAELLDKANIY